MDYDLALVIGLIVGVFAVPAMVSAMSERRVPRIAAIAVIVGGGLAAWSITQKPGGYTLGEVPDVIVSVVARYVK